MVPTISTLLPPVTLKTLPLVKVIDETVGTPVTASQLALPAAEKFGAHSVQILSAVGVACVTIARVVPSPVVPVQEVTSTQLSEPDAAHDPEVQLAHVPATIAVAPVKREVPSNWNPQTV